MIPLNNNNKETGELANKLSGQYGPLALARAAGQAAAAERAGDPQSQALWHSVVAHLRLTRQAG